MDEHVEFEEADGCAGQLKNAIVGLLVAPILLLVAGGLLFWNEGRAVQRARDLDQGRNSVVSLDSPQVDPANDGKLVHTSGEMEVDEPVADQTFGVSAEAVELRRTVEMFQWHEEKETETVRRNGEKVKKTTYEYHKDWSADVIDSGHFEDREGHRNPGQMPYDSKRYRPGEVRLGGFVLGAELIDRIDQVDPYPLEESVMESIPADHQSSATLRDDTIFLDGSPRAPEIGDVRVEYSWIQPGPVSVVAGQTDSTLNPYTSQKLNGEIGLVRTGTHSAGALFDEAEAENTRMTWILRGVGWLVAVIAVSMLFGPLEVIAGSLPMVGWIAEDLIETGATLISLLLGSAYALVVVAVGWLAYRPLIGLGLLAVVAACLGGVVVLVAQTRRNRT